MRRFVVLLSSISLGLACTYAAAGESEYNPNAAPNSQAHAEFLKTLQYFCHADTWDHTAYYITNVFTVPNPGVDTITAVDTEWMAYANETYGKRNMAYPHCEGIGAKDMPRTFESFKQAHRQTEPRVPIVELSWRAAGGAAAQSTGAAAQAAGAVAQPAGATAQPAGVAAQSAVSAAQTAGTAQTPVAGAPAQTGATPAADSPSISAATVEQAIDGAADAATKAAGTAEKAVDAADKVQKAATSVQKKLSGLLHH